MARKVTGSAWDTGCHHTVCLLTVLPALHLSPPCLPSRGRSFAGRRQASKCGLPVVCVPSPTKPSGKQQLRALLSLGVLSSHRLMLCLVEALRPRGLCALPL